MANRKPKVLVIGDCYIDMSLQCEHFPAPGEVVKGSGFSYVPMGSAVMQSIQAALCGCEVSAVASIGQGQCARFVTETLKNYYVNTELIFTAQAKSTGISITFIKNSDGAASTCIIDGANSCLTAEHLSCATIEQAISDSNCVIINSNSSDEAIAAVVSSAQIHRTATIFNFKNSLSSFVKEIDSKPIQFQQLDILIAEASAEISGEGIHEMKLTATELIGRGIKNVIVRTDKKGSLIVNKDGTSIIETPDSEAAQLSNGTDSFVAAIAACCGVRDTMDSAVKFASAAALLSSQKSITPENLPRKTEIIELLQQWD